VILELRGVGVTYPGPPAHVALRDVDLALAAGAYAAVVGPSGSGKSTLLNMLGLLDRPTSGTRTLLGVEVESLAPREVVRLRAGALGFVFQAFHLIPRRTVLDNVAVGGLYSGMTRAGRTAAAEEALERVGMTARSGALVDHLSGGERQRVAIARAVITDPPVLLCDEPTGNLDTHTSDQVLDLLDELGAGGTTLVVVTHNPDVAARADQELRVRDGRVERAR
jgi:putative ABC transport system ATP-binding protein